MWWVLTTSQSSAHKTPAQPNPAPLCAGPHSSLISSSPVPHLPFPAARPLCTAQIYEEVGLVPSHPRVGAENICATRAAAKPFLPAHTAPRHEVTPSSPVLPSCQWDLLSRAHTARMHLYFSPPNTPQEDISLQMSGSSSPGLELSCL